MLLCGAYCTIYQNIANAAAVNADDEALETDLLTLLTVATNIKDIGSIETILSIRPLSGVIVQDAEAVLATKKTEASKTRESRRRAMKKSQPSGKSLEDQLKEMKLPKKFEKALKDSNYKDAYNALMTDPEGAHQQALTAIGASDSEKLEVTNAAAKIKDKK